MSSAQHNDPTKNMEDTSAAGSSGKEPGKDGEQIPDNEGKKQESGDVNIDANQRSAGNEEAKKEREEKEKEEKNGATVQDIGSEQIQETPNPSSAAPTGVSEAPRDGGEIDGKDADAAEVGVDDGNGSVGVDAQDQTKHSGSGSPETDEVHVVEEEHVAGEEKEGVDPWDAGEEGNNEKEEGGGEIKEEEVGNDAEEEGVDPWERGDDEKENRKEEEVEGGVDPWEEEQDREENVEKKNQQQEDDEEEGDPWDQEDDEEIGGRNDEQEQGGDRKDGAETLGKSGGKERVDMIDADLAMDFNGDVSAAIEKTAKESKENGAGGILYMVPLRAKFSIRTMESRVVWVSMGMADKDSSLMSRPFVTPKGPLREKARYVSLKTAVNRMKQGRVRNLLGTSTIKKEEGEGGSADLGGGANEEGKEIEKKEDRDEKGNNDQEEKEEKGGNEEGGKQEEGEEKKILEDGGSGKSDTTSNSGGDKFPAYATIEVWTQQQQQSEAEESIPVLQGKAFLSLKFLKDLDRQSSSSSSPVSVQCRWAELSNGNGAVRVCCYYSKSGIPPKGDLKRLIKRRESQTKQKKNSMELKAFVGTWNLSGRDPPKDLGYFIPVGLYDIYMIGTQECGASIEESILTNYTTRWEAQLMGIFSEDYVRVDSTYMVALHGIVFIRKALAQHLSQVEKSYVPTGFVNLVGNKGGIGLSFTLGKSSILFITSHFHAFVDKVELRNADFHSIEQRLPMRKSSNGPKACSDRFDFTFWAGDLNYRCLCNRAIADTLLRDNNIEPLLLNEQLKQQQLEKKVFDGYKEAPLTFPPTYKFDVGTNSYDSSKKKRVPSWTDRILWKDKKGVVECMQYSNTASIRTSDHKPVSAIFLMEIEIKNEEEKQASKGDNNVKSSTCVLQ